MAPDPIASVHTPIENALDRHLYISTRGEPPCAVLCYDPALCYLFNVIGHGSLTEIELNLHRYFTAEQIEQACCNLHRCLDYALSVMDSSKHQHASDIFQRCAHDTIDPGTLLSIIELIHVNHVASFLPISVASDWLHMIRSIQNLEKLDTVPTASLSNLVQQMFHLKENLVLLHNLVNHFYPASPDIQPPPMRMSSLPNDQCCLRTTCSHNPMAFLATPAISVDSPPSSWSSTDMDVIPVATASGFVRNPVTNFIMPTVQTVPDMESSMLSFDDCLSSDDEQELPLRSFSRRFSCQSSSSGRTGPMVVKRADVLWVYPAAVIKPKSNLLSSSVYESLDPSEFKPLYGRANSCNIDLSSKKEPEPPPKAKPKKSPTKAKKGWRVVHLSFPFEELPLSSS